MAPYTSGALGYLEQAFEPICAPRVATSMIFRSSVRAVQREKRESCSFINIVTTASSLQARSIRDLFAVAELRAIDDHLPWLLRKLSYDPSVA